MIFGPSDSTIDFTLTGSQIIEEAFDLCGIGAEGEAVSADMYARALRSLNLIVKAWGAEEHLWLRTDRTLALVAGQAAYAVEPKPMRITAVARANIASSIETSMMEWSRSEYNDMPNKITQSIPTAFYYDPQRTAGTLYVWPAPSAATAAQFRLTITYLRTLQDFDSTNDSPDLPQEWLLALCYGLAEQLAIKYNAPARIAALITQRAAIYKAQINSWDTEPSSLFLQPDNG